MTQTPTRNLVARCLALGDEARHTSADSGGKAWKERAEDLSLGSAAAAENRRAQGRATRNDNRRTASKPS